MLRGEINKIDIDSLCQLTCVQVSDEKFHEFKH